MLKVFALWTLLTISFCVNESALAGEKKAQPKFTVSEVQLVVENLPIEAEGLGLTKELITTRARQRLQEAGLSLSTSPPYSRMRRVPYSLGYSMEAPAAVARQVIRRTGCSILLTRLLISQLDT